MYLGINSFLLMLLRNFNKNSELRLKNTTFYNEHLIKFYLIKLIK